MPIDGMTMNRYDPAIFAIRCVARVTDGSAQKMNRIIPLPQHLGDYMVNRGEGIQQVVIINRFWGGA